MNTYSGGGGYYAHALRDTKGAATWVSTPYSHVPQSQATAEKHKECVVEDYYSLDIDEVDAYYQCEEMVRYTVYEVILEMGFDPQVVTEFDPDICPRQLIVW